MSWDQPRYERVVGQQAARRVNCLAIRGQEPGDGVLRQPVHLEVGVKLAQFTRHRQIAAAISVEPEPPKRSSTMSPRAETSLIASAIIATGLTVGCKGEFVHAVATEGVQPL